MVGKPSIPERIFDVCNTVLLLIITFVTLYPMLYVLFASLSTPAAIYQSKGLLLYPKQVIFDGYMLVLRHPGVAFGAKNTFIYMTLGTTINMLLTSMGAYVLSRKHLKFGKPLMLMIVFTMYISGGLIPLFLIVKGLGLYNTIWAVLLPSAISTWNLIVMRTSFLALPDSLEESAKIDGANDFLILFRIVIPLSLPVIAVMTLFYAVDTHWNAWFYASIFFKDREMYPLQLILREILIQNVERDSMRLVTGNDIKAVEMMQLLKYSVIIVTTVPVLFIYPFLQKYFVKGVMIGSLKE